MIVKKTMNIYKKILIRFVGFGFVVWSFKKLIYSIGLKYPENLMQPELILISSAGILLGILGTQKIIELMDEIKVKN